MCSITGTGRVESNRGSVRAQRLPSAQRLAVPALALLAGLWAAGAASALGLDEFMQQSALGEPLRIVIPVILSGNDKALTGDLLGQCFKLSEPPVDRSEPDVPRLTGGRLSLEQSARGTRLVVTTTRPINDPVLTVTVEVGCTASVRRQYTLLLDPPAIEPPTAETAQADASPPSHTAGALQAPVETAARLARATIHRPAASSGRAPRGAKPIRHAERRAAGAGAIATAAAPKPPSPAPAANPQLSVSRGADDAERPRAASGPIAAGAAVQPSLADVEVETVVLQRRVAELSETAQRMQQELRSAQAARDAAEAAAKQARSAPRERASYGNWPLFAALIALVCLLAVAMWSGRSTFKRSALGSVVALDSDTMGSTLLPESEIVDTGRLAVPAKPPRAAPPPAASPTVTPSAQRDDPELAFDADLAKHVERYAGYSALEREYPRLVSQLVHTWGRPEVIGNLRDTLIYPRAGTKRLSREAVSELMLLQAIAMQFSELALDAADRS